MSFPAAKTKKRIFLFITRSNLKVQVSTQRDQCLFNASTKHLWGKKKSVNLTGGERPSHNSVLPISKKARNAVKSDKIFLFLL